MKSLRNTFLLLTAFSIAMGYLESAVVVYLRTIYYPTGFHFPLVALNTQIGTIEMFREAATMIMLLTIAFVAAKKNSQRFPYFIFCFAVWDIFYYIFLKLLLGWPTSVFDYDILFLIPVPWTGPALAPCIVSLMMILFSVAIVFRENEIKFNRTDHALIAAGSVIVVFSFCLDFIQYAVRNNIPLSKVGTITSLGNFVPTQFHWWIFILGMLFFVILFSRKIIRKQ
jgi:hypothetical protein